MLALVQPCRGHITQVHGARQSHNGLPHAGQDYAYYSSGHITDEVFAAAAGVVMYVGDSRALGWPNAWYFNPDFNRADAVDSSAGNVLVIRHSQAGVEFDTTYSHLAAWSVAKGQRVAAGERVATIGATGFSAGKHLHFELLVHPFNFGTPTYGRTNPNPYFVAGITAQGSTTTTENEDEMTPQQMQEIKDFTYRTLGTMLGQFHDVTRAHIITEVAKKIEDSAYEVKVFTQAVDNENTDRAILDNRAVEAGK